MAYADELESRLREVVEGEPGLREQRMFGGLAFLVDREHGGELVGRRAEGSDGGPVMADPPSDLCVNNLV